MSKREPRMSDKQSAALHRFGADGRRICKLGDKAMRRLLALGYAVVEKSNANFTVWRLTDLGRQRREREVKP